MTEFSFTDRPARGRPWNNHSLEVVQRLEANMQEQRKAMQEARTGEGTMLWFCKDTRQTMYLVYPLKYTPLQALEQITSNDIEHLHRPWETYYL